MKIIISTIIIIMLLTIGCLNEDEQKPREITYTDVLVHIITDSNETSAINETNASIELENLGYEVNIQKGNGGGVNGILCKKWNGHLSIFISTDPSNPYIAYVHSKTIKESMVGDEQDKTEKELTQIAEICNLTLDWSLAEWTWN